ncbi:hypothetical protein BKA82DRAFT_35868 [Pisolithus tinctorius]|uniref:Uncharacterized protein n=1 Tax=Pisolithus tinctorius Marx 270 TaxID=870435 RepID=A0A0C3NDM0_PISTI|nr:hypothetical protein BKA82DRAFT_35868 [Pisolithus tinctorius]KIN93688.1 hypothetical protein M404DRAFT_35868 [Pisolithus tinctorius Marx 270]
MTATHLYEASALFVKFCIPVVGSKAVCARENERLQLATVLYEASVFFIKLHTQGIVIKTNLEDSRREDLLPLSLNVLNLLRQHPVPGDIGFQVCGNIGGNVDDFFQMRRIECNIFAGYTSVVEGVNDHLSSWFTNRLYNRGLVELYLDLIQHPLKQFVVEVELFQQVAGSGCGSYLHAESIWLRLPTKFIITQHSQKPLCKLVDCVDNDASSRLLGLQQSIGKT